MFPLRDTIPSRHFPWMTWLLILGCGGVFLHELTLADNAIERLFNQFGIIPARFTSSRRADWVGQTPVAAWSFLTSQYLHAGWIHLLANVWTLSIFGDNVEDRMGPTRFLAFYTLCGVAAGITHCVFHPASTIPTVGASGAIAGVLGAYVLMYPMARVVTLVPVFFLPLFVDIPAFIYLGIWFVGQFFSGALALSSPEHVGGVAWWAHIGGFVFGLLTHRLFFSKRRRGSFSRRQRSR